MDSSIIVKWLNHSEELRLKQADDVLQQAIDGEIQLFCPDIALYEVGNALLHKKIDTALVETALTTLYVLPITFIHLNLSLAQSMIQFAAYYTMTYYDAAFVALAKEFGATLVTDNPKHQKKDHGVNVVALAEYNITL